MKYRLLLSAAALSASAYDAVETVLVKGGPHGSYRVNKDDFDADQASDKPQYTAYKGDGENDAPQGTMSDVNATNAGGVQTTAAPSAPNFGGGETVNPLPIDPVKQAAAPVGTSADQLLVMKSGKKFYICDGSGVKVTGDRAKLLGIDEEGYSTEEAAKAVQTRTEPSDAPVPTTNA